MAWNNQGVGFDASLDFQMPQKPSYWYGNESPPQNTAPDGGFVLGQPQQGGELRPFDEAASEVAPDPTSQQGGGLGFMGWLGMANAVGALGSKIFDIATRPKQQAPQRRSMMAGAFK